MAVYLTTSQVIYAAQSRILELAEEVYQSNSFKRVRQQIRIGEALLRYIRALQQSDHHLSSEEETAICQHMIEIGNLYDFAAVPDITNSTVYNLSSGVLVGPRGEQGPPGQDGGGTDYESIGVSSTRAVDSFSVSVAQGAEWSYIVKRGSNLRAGRVGATWLTDGSNVTHYEYSTADIGDTSGITFSVVYSGGNIELRADITFGSWDISGTRYFIPNNGVGVVVKSTALPSGQLFVGNSINEAQARAITGHITLDNLGVAQIASNSIVNSHVNTEANIAVSKLASLVPNRAVTTDTNGKLTVSATTAEKLGFLANVTSDVQAQLDGKIGNITGAISNIVTSDLTQNRVAITNSSGKLTVSNISSQKLIDWDSYLSGVTSNVQAQINSLTTSVDNKVQGGGIWLGPSDSVGTYYGINAGSGPTSFGWPLNSRNFLVISAGTTQLAICTSVGVSETGNIYFRLRSGSSWGSWTKINDGEGV